MLTTIDGIVSKPTSPPRLQLVKRAAHDGELDASQLVAALRRRDPAAAEQFFESYAPLVRRVIGKMIGSDHSLQDLVQDTFLQAFDKLDALENPAALRGWLLAAAVHRSQNHLRARRRSFLDFFGGAQELELPSWVTESDAAMSAPLRQQLHQTLQMLRPEDRTVIVLRFMEECSIAEIAVALSCSDATVKRRVTHAVERFEQLAQRFPEVRARIDELRNYTIANDGGEE